MAEEKKYAILGKDSVRAYAESVGYTGLSDEVVNLLAEDAVYRLREALQNGCQFMRHAKRRRLTTEDFNKALRMSDVQPILGHCSQEGQGSAPFKQTKEGDIFFPDDPEIKLAEYVEKPYVPCEQGQTTIKAHWLAVEGTPRGNSFTQGQTSKNRPVSQDLLNYYNNITKAILGSDVELIKFALTDLKSNSKIAPLLPYFVSFVANGVKTVSHDVSQLSKLLHTVKALVNNKSLYLEPRPFLNMLVQGVMYCLLEPLAASINPSNDHWTLRDYAARLLAQITRDWNSPVNHLKRQNIKALKDVLYDNTRPFCSHYGAIMGLIALGTKATEEVLLTHLAKYWPHLQAELEDLSTASHKDGVLLKMDASKVYGAILFGAELVVRSRQYRLLYGCDGLIEGMDSTGTDAAADNVMMTPTTDLPTPLLSPSGAFPLLDTKHQLQDLLGPVIQLPEDQDGKDLFGSVLQIQESKSAEEELAVIYNDLYSYFGDALASRLAINVVKNRFTQIRPLPEISLADEDSKKSGEELLQHFLLAKKEDDDVDVHSEKSSKSDRSGASDESAAFFDTDLTVKTSDDSKGIKLTIFKRPKKPYGKASPSTHKSDVPARSDPKRRRKQSLKSHPDRLSFFENFPLIKHQATPFVFIYAGCEQRSEPRMRPWSLYEQQTYGQRSSEAYTHGFNMPLLGKRIVKKTRLTNQLWINSASLSNTL